MVVLASASYCDSSSWPAVAPAHLPRPWSSMHNRCHMKQKLLGINTRRSSGGWRQAEE